MSAVRTRFDATDDRIGRKFDKAGSAPEGTRIGAIRETFPHGLDRKPSCPITALQTDEITSDHRLPGKPPYRCAIVM